MLSTSDLVDVWEQGWSMQGVGRALLLVSRCEPNMSWAELHELSIGRRNQELLEAHERLFGATLDCQVTCPECANELEFALDTRALGSEHTGPLERLRAFRDGDVELRFRLLDSRDLAAAACSESVEEARQVLVSRAVVSARRAGVELAAADLPEATVAALADELERIDPPVVWRLALTCDACGHAWPVSLDLVAYLWRKVASRARHALGEVHELASAYGWSEAEVLGLSDARRQAYLMLVRG